jgi:hypothetical protein
MYSVFNHGNNYYMWETEKVRWQLNIFLGFALSSLQKNILMDFPGSWLVMIKPL